jgi:hypothetical protein
VDGPVIGPIFFYTYNYTPMEVKDKELEVKDPKVSISSNYVHPLTEDGVQLSKEMLPPRIPKGKVIRYRLIESEKIDPSRVEIPSGKPMKKTPGYMMVGKKNVYDPITGQTVTIINKSIKKTTRTSIGEITNTRPESVKFLSDKPVVEVHWNQPELYAFLELASENKDNPWRDPRVPAMYERVDPMKKIAQEEEKDAFEFRALEWVRKSASYNELIACAQYYNKIHPDAKIKTDYKEDEATIGYGLLKKALYEFAKKDPTTIIKGSTDKAAVIELQMRDADRFKLILFIDGKKSRMPGHEFTWFHNDKELTSITQLTLEKNKFEGLVEFFQKDPNGKKHYHKIIEGLEKVLTPR